MVLIQKVFGYSTKVYLYKNVKPRIHMLKNIRALVANKTCHGYTNCKRISMIELIYKEESYEIIGKCMKVHNNLGPGFLEIVYKDALEFEFRKAGIPFEREKKYVVHYEDIILPHKFFADFVAS